MENNQFLTAREVSEKFFQGHIRYQCVLAMTRSGELPAKKIGKNYIYHWAALEDWAQNALRKPAWANHRK